MLSIVVDSLVFWILSFDCSFCLIAWYLYILYLYMNVNSLLLLELLIYNNIFDNSIVTEFIYIDSSSVKRYVMLWGKKDITFCREVVYFM